MENESLLETKESLQNKVQIKIFWKSCGFCQKSSHDLISKQRPDHGNRLEQAVYLWVDGSLFVWWRREISSLCNLFNNSWWNPASETGLFIYQSDLLTSLHSLNTFYLIFCVNTNFGSRSINKNIKCWLNFFRSCILRFWIAGSWKLSIPLFGFMHMPAI